MKKILDVTCGGRMMWFDKKHPNALYLDNRTHEKEKLSNRQQFEVAPDIVADFRTLPLEFKGVFSLVVFDPPHVRAGNGYTKKKYGSLSKDWKDDIRKGFAECFRVMKQDGVLIFKWNETHIPLKEVLALTPHKPLFGNRGGRLSKTHWVTFMKL